MSTPGSIRIGARVKILQPDYVAEQLGMVISREEIAEGQATDRWLIQVVDAEKPVDGTEAIVLSLLPQEFQVID